MGHDLLPLASFLRYRSSFDSALKFLFAYVKVNALCQRRDGRPVVCSMWYWSGAAYNFPRRQSPLHGHRLCPYRKQLLEFLTEGAISHSLLMQLRETSRWPWQVVTQRANTFA